MVYLEALAGLVLLLFGGDLLVRGAVTLAQRFRVPQLFIGLTVVAFGTSAPELMTCVEAVLANLPSMAIGNVVGSNIANVLLVLGLPSLILPMSCSGPGVLRNTLIMVFSTIGFILISMTGSIGFAFGLLLFGLLVTYLGSSARRAFKGRAAFEEQFFDVESVSGRIYRAPLALLITLAGIAGLVIGADLLITGGAGIAALWGVPDAVIGLTLVALGTSLPELATSLPAAFRKHSDVVIGNVVGSNLFNILGIMGITAMVKPVAVASQFLQYDMWVMLAVSAILIPLAWGKWPVGRILGIIFLLAYAAYIISLGRAWSGQPALM